MLATSSRFSVSSAVKFLPESLSSETTSTLCHCLKNESPEPPPRSTRFRFSSSTIGRLSITDPLITAGATRPAGVINAQESSRSHNRTTSELFRPLHGCLQWSYGNCRSLQHFCSFHSTSTGGLLLSPSRTRRGQFVTTEDACNFVNSLSNHQRVCLENAMRGTKEEERGKCGKEGEERVETHPPTWHQLRLCKS